VFTVPPGDRNAGLRADVPDEKGIQGEAIMNLGLFEILRQPEKYNSRLVATEGIFIRRGMEDPCLAMSQEGIWGYAPDVLIDLRIEPAVREHCLVDDNDAKGKFVEVTGRLSYISEGKRDRWAKLQFDVHFIIVHGASNKKSVGP